MLIPLLLLGWGCQEAPAPAGPAPAAVVAPGTYLAEGFPLRDGHEVLAICGDRLERLPVRLTREGEHLTPEVSCDWQVLLGGIDDRVGPGTLVRGTFGSQGTLSPPLTVKVGLGEARIHGRRTSEDAYEVVVRTQDRFVLAEVASPPTVGPTLIWAGDLDNDHATAWVVDTPERAGEVNLRLYLTTKQPDGRPEEVSSSRLRSAP